MSVTNELCITINGEKTEHLEECTVRELLIRLGLGSSPVVVELNGEALLPQSFDDKIVSIGSTLEIVSIVAGG